MSFKIVDLELYKLPCDSTIDDILLTWGIRSNEIGDALKKEPYTHSNSKKAFQEELHKQLNGCLLRFFISKNPNFLDFSQEYAPDFDLRADLTMKRLGSDKKIYIEIEFRDKNHFADIMKFQIGHKNDLELGILIVPKNKQNINPRYRTMIEFNGCKHILGALKLECPILLIGFDGIWEGEKGHSEGRSSKAENL